MKEIKMYDKESNQELLITDEFQMKAIANRNTILSNAGIVVNAIYEMSKGLKECRDEKLYLAFNYSSFKEYCENELSIGRTQAYKYISLIEKLGDEKLKENAHLGINRLVQITKEMEEEVKRDSRLKENEEIINNQIQVLGKAYWGMIIAYRKQGLLKQDSSKEENINILVEKFADMPQMSREIIEMTFDSFKEE